MIGQYLSNKNESATIAKSEIFSELNKATADASRLRVWELSVSRCLQHLAATFCAACCVRLKAWTPTCRMLLQRCPPTNMATGKIRADTRIMNLCPQEKIHTHARAPPPVTGSTTRPCPLSAGMPDTCREPRCSQGARVTGVTGRPAAGVGEPRVEEPCRSRREWKRLDTGGLIVVLGRSFGAGAGRLELETRKQASGVGEQT